MSFRSVLWFSSCRYWTFLIKFKVRYFLFAIINRIFHIISSFSFVEHNFYMLIFIIYFIKLLYFIVIPDVSFVIEIILPLNFPIHLLPVFSKVYICFFWPTLSLGLLFFLSLWLYLFISFLSQRAIADFRYLTVLNWRKVTTNL